MSILVGRDTKLLVQGITGREGSFHALRCREYGANLVAGVTPGRGGQMFEDDIPVYNSIRQAVDDTIRVVRYLKGKDTTLIGPNCPGIITPGEDFKMGIMPGHIHKAGRMGVVSRSGTLTYEAVGQLTDLGIGQSTCVGIGGDPVNGSTFVDILKKFQDDPDTDGVVMIGEIGGSREQEAAEYIGSPEFTKPIAALIVGQSAPAGKRMGHAGAIITGSAARADEKMKALAAAGVSIIPAPGSIGVAVQELMD